MGVVTLQLLAFLVVKGVNPTCYLWPPRFWSFRDFTMVEDVRNVRNFAARMILGHLYKATSFIGGGYAAYKCGLTSSYEDIDVFIAVQCGNSKGVANQIARYMRNLELIPKGTSCRRMYSGSDMREKYVLKVPALATYHKLYNECEGLGCDIVVVEVSIALTDICGVLREITRDFDLEVSRCVGVPVRVVKGVIHLVFMPGGGDKGLMEEMKEHTYFECPLLHKQVDAAWVYALGPGLRSSELVVDGYLREALVMTAVANYTGGYFSCFVREMHAGVKCYMATVADSSKAYAIQSAVRCFEDELAERRCLDSGVGSSEIDFIIASVHEGEDAEEKDKDMILRECSGIYMCDDDEVEAMFQIEQMEFDEGCGRDGGRHDGVETGCGRVDNRGKGEFETVKDCGHGRNGEIVDVVVTGKNACVSRGVNENGICGKGKAGGRGGKAKNAHVQFLRRSDEECGEGDDKETCESSCGNSKNIDEAPSGVVCDRNSGVGEALLLNRQFVGHCCPENYRVMKYEKRMVHNLELYDDIDVLLRRVVKDMYHMMRCGCGWDLD